MASSLTWNDLDFLTRIGEGRAGEVWTARLRRSFRSHPAGEVVAVKRYKRWLIEQAGQFDRIYRELTTGILVNHPNVVLTHCLVSDNDGLPALVMHYYEGVTLETLLASQRDRNERVVRGSGFFGPS
jgi:serine/threonine protein kinase